MRANGNVSDASVERFYSIRINRMRPSDAVDLGRPVTAYWSFRWFTVRLHSGYILSKIV